MKHMTARTLRIGILFGIVATQLAAEPAKKILVKMGTLSSAQLIGGKKAKVKVSFEVERGYHIQANPAEPPLIATSLRLKTGTDFQAFPPKYPMGKLYRVGGLNREIRTYDGLVTVDVEVQATPKAKHGKQSIGAELRFQACDDKLCYPPERLEFEIPADVR